MKKAPLYALISLLVGLSVSFPVSAAKASGSTTVKTGIDVSYPQCGSTLPTDHAFGIVGINGGTAASVNPCLATQLAWAKSAVGGTAQPLVQLYVNTANPGQVIDQVKTWPTDNVDQNGSLAPNRYGTCDGKNSLACSWQYGWERAVAAGQWFVPAAQSAGVDTNIGAYTWWLDVETTNTWQAGSSDAYLNNKATLEGMADYYQSKGAKVGLYSTSYQWGQVVGTTVDASSPLYTLNSWLAGARTLKAAQTNCKSAPLVAGGSVILAQFVSRGLDYNYSCI